ncbi:sigma 54-interacting transcriptional regulator [Peptostreptococcaceae bacterium AGR-M142]
MDKKDIKDLDSNNINKETNREKYCKNCTKELLEELIELRRISKKLDAVIESSYDGIYITDGNAKTLRINKSYERITGIKKDTLLGKTMYDLEKEGFVSKSGTLVVLNNKRSTTLQQTLKTGKKILITSTPVFDENDEIEMVVTNVRDVTELMRLKEELEENKKRADKYYNELEEMRKQIIDRNCVVVKDHKMKDIYVKAKRVAYHDTTVLITGETGVGKEVVAKYIHKNSKRNKKPFIKVNCGAIPENLIESELFGYEKGAFTGASNKGKMGLFEVANGGTIFLDEIGELPLSMQVKLLRVLQEQEIQRIGAINTIKIDVRIITATNKDLLDLSKKNLFREDLYYRLNIVPIHVLPLRERKEDIIPLAEEFLTNLNKKYAEIKKFDYSSYDLLYSYDWPGNVRELKNIVERVFVMGRDDYIKEDDFPDSIINEAKVKENLNIKDEIWDIKKASSIVEANLIKKAFDKYNNVRDAAKALNINASTFVRKRKKYEDEGYLK